MRKTRLLGLSLGLSIAALACGGGQKGETTNQRPGESHASDLDVDKNGSSTTAGTTPDAGVSTAEAETPDAAPAPKKDAPLVTFRLHNKSTVEELEIAIDKGWSHVIFAYTGKPPKAKSVILFPKHCTASCDTAAEERCPYCPAPERNKDEKAAEERIVVASGATHEVAWDGQVHDYKKTKVTVDGRRKKCDCFDKKLVPQAEYTVKACGLRVTKVAGERSRYECAEAKVSWPPTAPTVIDLEFPGTK